MATTMGALAMIALLTGNAPAAVQERAPNGQIYRELLPFVGLDGVRLQIIGLGGGIFNIPEQVADPEKAVTGLTRAEHQELEKRIRGDITEAFQQAAIPLLPAPVSSSETRPALVLHISWARVKADMFTIQVRIDLMEAARLLKDTSRIVWTSTWGSTYNSVASDSEELSRVVRSVTRGQLDTFVRLYARAHVQGAARTP